MSMGKTGLFIRGHIGLMRRIEKACKGVDSIIWVHSASYGEFEEVRPVVTAIRKAHPEYRILVTFFSPSGYEHLKTDEAADFVFYLPIATRRNAVRFLDAIRPVRVIISISDYWLPYLHELRKRHIRTYLTSARFEESMFYFKPLGRPYLDAFKTCFTKIIVRDVRSMEILEKYGVTHAVLSGDPRIDRVLALAATDWADDRIDRWIKDGKAFVGGSVLPDMDSTVMAALVNSHPEDRFLIIPHETNDGSIATLRRLINGRSVLYTDDDIDANVMIVNTVGMLSKLYRYGFAAYVGAGFDGAPHSIVEPAAYGIPVAYGPQFGSHYHCQYMIDCGGGHSVKDAEELILWYDRLKSDSAFLEGSGKAARQYCIDRSGVADSIMRIVMDGDKE